MSPSLQEEHCGGHFIVFSPLEEHLWRHFHMFSPLEGLACVFYTSRSCMKLLITLSPLGYLDILLSFPQYKSILKGTSSYFLHLKSTSAAVFPVFSAIRVSLRALPYVFSTRKTPLRGTSTWFLRQKCKLNCVFSTSRSCMMLLITFSLLGYPSRHFIIFSQWHGHPKKILDCVFSTRRKSLKVTLEREKVIQKGTSVI